MEQNENTQESFIAIWVTAAEGASFDTYRNDPSVGAEIHLPLAPATLTDALAREARREGVEPGSLRLCAWEYIGRFAPFEWLPLGEDYTFEEANLLAAVVMHNPEIDCDVLFQYCDLSRSMTRLRSSTSPFSTSQSRTASGRLHSSSRRAS